MMDGHHLCLDIATIIKVTKKNANHPMLHYVSKQLDQVWQLQCLEKKRVFYSQYHFLLLYCSGIFFFFFPDNLPPFGLQHQISFIYC